MGNELTIGAERIRAAYAAAESFYHYQFYFGKHREARKLCEKFEIDVWDSQVCLGCTAEGRAGLKRALLSQGFTEGELLQAGLLYKSASGATYDKYRNRLILPCYTETGELIGFHGRILKDGNSPEWLFGYIPTESPRDHFFGLHILEREKHGTIILVEDDFSVLRLRQCGFANAVSPMWKLSDAAFARLKRCADRVVLLTGSDEWGKSLACEWREGLAKQGMCTCAPDMGAVSGAEEFIQSHGAEKLQQLIQTAWKTGDDAATGAG